MIHYMNHNVRLILILTVLVLVSNQYVSLAQDSTVRPETRHIVILNKKYEPFKEINIGDEVRLILTNSTRVKGHITSIDSTFFTVDANVVHLNEIEQISTKKTWQQVLGIPLVALGGLYTIAGLANIGDIADDNLVGAALLLGIPITAIGVGIMSPGYHRIGKNKRFIVISRKQID